jgi:hypothetical protein
MSKTVTVKQPKDESDAVPPVTVKDGAASEINEELPGNGAPKTAEPVTSKPPTPLEALTAFLAQHSITDDSELAVFKRLRIPSLNDLLEVLRDEPERRALSDALVASGARFAVRKLQGITVEAVKNEIYFLKNPGAKDSAEPLLDFLAVENVLSDPKDRDVLLCMLLENNTPSLAALHKLKAGGHRQLDTLTGAITRWDAAGGAAFRRITPAMVARAGNPAQKIDEDLQAYLKHKAKLPSGAENVLAEFGVTSLDQLKRVKEDPAQSQVLAGKLQDAGILNAREAFDKITVEDIQEEISTLDSPVTAQAKRRQTELQQAIRDVRELRTQVEGATQANLKATVTKVGQEYSAVIGRVRDAWTLEFEQASSAALESQTSLKGLLDRTIENAEKAVMVLREDDKTEMAMTKLIRQLEMLCGALLTPAEIVMKRTADLMSMPDDPNQLAKATEAQESVSIQYTGSETSSFASSYASQTGSSFSTTTDTAAAGFVGTGIGAISAAASYSDARKASQDQETFHSFETARCGEIRYIFAPKRTVQFTENDIRLSNDARRELGSIAGVAQPAEQAKRIRSFYHKFGSHFFTRYSLGGRYEFNATGENTSAAGKAKLVTAVSNGADWAVSSSASYLGLGGAVNNANAVVGSTTSAQAEADQMRFTTDSASVRVSIKVLGGAGLSPRDVWAQSLAFNSTWAVIGRAEPIAIWEILRRVPQKPALPASTTDLAPILEEVWVRDIFREAVRDSNPILYSRIGNDPTIRTCAELEQLVRKLQAADPPVQVLIVERTSSSAGHPKIIAQAASTKGLKLIGGGARVDSGNGVGNLLTGSYPEGEGWVASSKEHIKASPATVTAFAIYLVDPEDIWDVKRVEVSSEQRSNRPEATAELPAGYALTGGGALVHGYGSNGVLLTHCCPVVKDGGYRAWTAQGKDHVKIDEALATAWAIGIRCKNMPPGVNPALPQVISQVGLGAGRGHASSKAAGELVIVGGGAAVNYRAKGGLLTATYPDRRSNGWSASAKDHIEEDSFDVTVWCIARPGEAITEEATQSARAR